MLLLRVAESQHEEAPMHTIARTVASRAFLTVAASIGVAIQPVHIRAQESGALKAIVITADHKPLPLAGIRVIGTALAAVSDSDGAFRIAALPLPREGPFGPSYAVQSTRADGVDGGRGCQVLFYVNGIPFPVTSDLEINHYVAPDEVAAVEIYTGASQIPPQFNSSTLNARCGVVVKSGRG
jgi:hypothetical protein